MLHKSFPVKSSSTISHLLLLQSKTPYRIREKRNSLLYNVQNQFCWRNELLSGCSGVCVNKRCLHIGNLRNVAVIRYQDQVKASNPLRKYIYYWQIYVLFHPENTRVHWLLITSITSVSHQFGWPSLKLILAILHSWICIHSA